MILLWHGDDPAGVCVFAAPAAALTPRSRAFGLCGASPEAALAALNERVWLLQRVVLAPTYRGTGLAWPFVRAACEACPVDWVECLSVLGRANPFLDRAGFVRRGAVTPGRAASRAGCYGRRSNSRPSAPAVAAAYYLFDNRARRLAPGGAVG